MRITPKMSRRLLSLIVFTFVVYVPYVFGQSNEYLFTEVDPSLSIENLFFKGINEKSQIVGSQGGFFQPNGGALWTAHSFQTPNFSSNLGALDINLHSQVLLQDPTDPQFGVNDFWLPQPTNTLTATLSTLPGGVVRLNDVGQIVGNGPFISGANWPYIYQNGVSTSLQTPLAAAGADLAIASDINNSGEVSGGLHLAAGGGDRCYKYSSGTVTYTPSVGLNLCYSAGINQSGITVGAVQTTSVHSSAFKFDGVNFTLLSAPSGYQDTDARAINDAGTVVGVMGKIGQPPAQSARAFVYDSVNGVRDLNLLTVLPSGFVMEAATAINECGQIIGWGNKNGTMTSWLVTPRNTGMVFLPDPVTSAHDLTLADNNDLNSYQLNSQRRCVRLQGLVGDGSLHGAYAQSTSPSIVNEPSEVFDYLRQDIANNGFEETNAYYHIDSARRYLDSLGLPIPTTFTGSAMQFIVNDSTLGDNSKARSSSTGPGRLDFGSGGVDDAEDPMVIWHEYAHGIQRHLVPGWGVAPASTVQTKSMDEGFADFWAASSFIGSGPPTFENSLDAIFAPWDATSLASFKQRVLDNTSKHFPEQFTGTDQYEDCEIWSNALWQMLPIIGRDRVNSLYVRAIKRLNDPAAGFNAVANAMLLINNLVYSGLDQAAIKNIFIQKGILVALTGISLSPTSVQGGNSITATAILSGQSLPTTTTVTLTTTNAAVILPVPPVIIIPQGEYQQGISVGTSTVSTLTTGNIIASFDGVSVSAAISVTP